MRDGQPVPQTALDSHQSHNQAETVLSAGSYTLKEGDRLYWKVCENIEPKLTDKSSHPVLEQIVEACTPEIRLKLTPQDESEVAEAIDRVSETLIATLDQAGFESAESRIRLIVEESILNAWRHGNKKNPKKSIHLRWRLGVDCILEVKDEGSGFDYQSLVDPRRAENIYKLSGRGIFIVNNYAGKIEWALGGRLVRIMIQRAIPDEQTLQNCTNLVEYCKAMSQK
jgi:anti-sigma regulatory factor (Ser/Thr protein kinase)